MTLGKKLQLLRKARSMSQEQLAEALGVSRQAVSKWETGKSLPDSSLMLPLCEILSITVNDLLCGEVVTVEKYDKKLEYPINIKKKEKRE